MTLAAIIFVKLVTAAAFTTCGCCLASRRDDAGLILLAALIVGIFGLCVA